MMRKMVLVHTLENMVLVVEMRMEIDFFSFLYRTHCLQPTLLFNMPVAILRLELAGLRTSLQGKVDPIIPKSTTYFANQGAEYF